ncbi:MAG: oligosaccharide flippase family protein, partial [Acidobacteria bacterium]|nr:oligosaccharide flippase family protein [Acidobacteriota bacterium]
LAALAAIGMLAAPLIMRLLLIGVHNNAVRQAETRLGTVLLWCFLPQVVLYASHMVATARLNARGHFAAPAVAPLLNNVVVTLSYGIFWHLRHGKAPGLTLTLAEKLVLGLGTTAGVLAFCALPVVAAVRTGISMRPRFDHRHSGVRVIGRRGLWAAVFLAATQVLQGVVLVFANRVEGGVVAWTLAFTLFLLPHSLISLPVMTALFPAMSRHAVAKDETAYGQTISAGLRSIAFVVLPATAAMIALGRPLADLLRLGEFRGGGANQVAAAVAAFGPGLVGYGSFLFLSRSLYARGDTRTPALVNLAVVVVGCALMAGAFESLHGDARVAGLAAGHSVAYLGGSLALFLLVRARAQSLPAARIAGSLGRASLAAALAGAAMWLARQPFHGDGRADAVVQLAVAGGVGLVVYVFSSSLFGGPRPGHVPAMLRGLDD